MKSPRWFSSLRTRILIAIIGLVLLGMGSLGLFAAQQIAANEMENFTQRLATFADNLADELVELLEDDLEDGLEDGKVPKAVLSIMDRHAQTSNFRVTFIHTDGHALYDSSGILPARNLFTDPEFGVTRSQQQPTSSQRDDEQGIEHLWFTTPIRYEGKALGYIRAAAPTAEPYAEIRRRLSALGGVCLLLMLLAIVLGTWLANSLTRPLQTLRTTALTLASGDLDQRVPELETDEMRTVGQAFNEMAEQVQNMVVEQQAFAGNAAHELRTPITAIRLRTERMLRGVLEQETLHEYIAEIDSEATRMGGLVDDLTLLARLDANRLQIGESEVDISRVAAALIEELQPRAQRKSITLTLDRPSRLTPVTATTNHVQVVLRNLLDNALKYTPEGGRVTCQVTQQPEAILITIVDTGEGIATADLPRVVQRFYRADQAHTRAVDGVGLGLSLVTSLIATYGGTLQISSRGIDQGTTASVVWPVS